MATRAKPEDITEKLREVEIRLNQGETTGKAVRIIGVTEQTYYRRCKGYGRMGIDQKRQLKGSEKGNHRLRHAVSDLTLDNRILADLFFTHGPQEHVRCDNGPKFIGRALWTRLGGLA